MMQLSVYSYRCRTVSLETEAVSEGLNALQAGKNLASASN